MHEEGNDIETIKLWINWVVDQANLTEAEKTLCKDASLYNELLPQMWRGDLTELWRGMGFTNEQFNFELFV